MKVSIISVGALLAAIPAQVGFVPVESVVFVLARRGVLTVAVRVDWQGAVTVAPDIVGVARDTGSDTVYVVAISSEIEAYDAAGLAAVELDAAGLITHPIAVPVIGDGAQWQHLTSGERGLCEDYRASVMTVAMATETGRYVAASRDDMVASLTARTAPVEVDTARAAYRADRDGFAAAVAADVVAIATGQRAGDDQVAARLGVLVVENIAARDALVWLVHRDAATAAGYLTGMAAPLRGPYRVQVLTILAVLWAISGTGPAARAIIDTTHAEGHPVPSLMLLLDQALRYGAPPRIVTEAITGGVDAERAAAALGGYRRP